MILITTGVLAGSHVALFVYLAKRVLPQLTWYNPLTSAFAALAAFSVAFLALGRYKVLRDPTSYWIGMGFASMAVGLVFYVLSWPGLLPDAGSFIAHGQNAALWTGRPLPVILATFLLCAVVFPWPGERALAGRRWLWSMAAWLAVVTLLEVLIVIFEDRLPVLVRGDGAFSPANTAMQLALALAFGVGAILSTRRYLRTGDALLAYVAVCQIAYTFTEVTLSIAGRRYSVWWYTNRVLLVSGFLFVLFGFLNDYVGLLRTAREKTRELQAKSAELEGERSRWQGVVEGIADEVWVCDANGSMTLINLPEVTAMRLNGFKDRSILDVMAEVDILYPDGEPRPPAEAPLLRSLRGEIVRGEEIMRHRQTGRVRYRQFSSAPTRDAEGRITGSVAIVRDITDRKQAEEALVRTEKLAATGRLAATIAHEINNPLAAMTNVVYLLEQTVTDARAREYIQLIDKQLQTVTRIATQTLKFHRDHGQAAEYKLSEIVAELLEFYQSKAARQGVTVVQRGDTEGALVGFGGEIRQVLSNLLLNAIEATPAGGKIAVHLHAGADWRNPGTRGYRCTVVDSGSGIEPRHRARIFEPFFTTKGEKGTGLGLWVSMGIVQRAGGSMRVWSTQRPGRSGTCFSLFLPATPIAARPARRRYEAEKSTGMAV